MIWFPLNVNFISRAWLGTQRYGVAPRRRGSMATPDHNYFSTSWTGSPCNWTALIISSHGWAQSYVNCCNRLKAIVRAI